MANLEINRSLNKALPAAARVISTCAVATTLWYGGTPPDAQARAAPTPTRTATMSPTATATPTETATPFVSTKPACSDARHWENLANTGLPPTADRRGISDYLRAHYPGTQLFYGPTYPGTTLPDVIYEVDPQGKTYISGLWLDFNAATDIRIKPETYIHFTDISQINIAPIAEQGPVLKTLYYDIYTNAHITTRQGYYGSIYLYFDLNGTGRYGNQDLCWQHNHITETPTATRTDVPTRTPPFVVTAEPTTVPGEPITCESKNIAILSDGSGSQADQDFSLQKAGIESVLQFLRNSESVWTLIQFSSDQIRYFRLQPYSDDLVNQVAGMAELKQGTDMTTAINAVSDELKGDSPNRVLFIFTDGVPDDATTAITAANALKSQDPPVTIIGIGTGYVRSDILSQIASPGQEYTLVSPADTSRLIPLVLSVLCGHRSTPSHEQTATIATQTPDKISLLFLPLVSRASTTEPTTKPTPTLPPTPTSEPVPPDCPFLPLPIMITTGVHNSVNHQGQEILLNDFCITIPDGQTVTVVLGTSPNKQNDYLADDSIQIETDGKKQTMTFARPSATEPGRYVFGRPLEGDYQVTLGPGIHHLIFTARDIYGGDIITPRLYLHELLPAARSPYQLQTAPWTNGLMAKAARDQHNRAHPQDLAADSPPQTKQSQGGQVAARLDQLRNTRPGWHQADAKQSPIAGSIIM